MVRDREGIGDESITLEDKDTSQANISIKAPEEHKRKHSQWKEACRLKR